MLKGRNEDSKEFSRSTMCQPEKGEKEALARKKSIDQKMQADGEHTFTYAFNYHCLCPNHMLDTVRPRNGEVFDLSLKGLLFCQQFKKHKRGTSKLYQGVKIGLLNEGDFVQSVRIS